jgi:hypothetical protein
MLLFGGIVTDFFPEYLTIANLLLFRFNSLSLSRIHLNDEYQGVDLDETHPCVFLVILDSPYHMEVPILLGTNILTSIMNTYKEKHGERFLQISKLTTPWYSSFRCIKYD